MMQSSQKWLIIILIIAGLYGVSVGISYLYQGGTTFEDNIAVIPIHGVISFEESRGFGFTSSEANAEHITQFIEQANNDPSTKGILLDINSPGGTVIASKEIATAVKASEKPVVAVIREVGASGAYWIASASDYIIADELSITGSIGVVGSYLEFSELFEKYGVNYERLVGGEHKDAGSPFKKLTQEEERLLQKKIDLIHEAFIQEVATNRNMSIEDVRTTATGMFYLGSEAKTLGLIDATGTKDDALTKVKELANTPDATIIEYEERHGLFDVLSGMQSNSAYYFGRGFARELSEINVEQDYQINAR